MLGIRDSQFSLMAGAQRLQWREPLAALVRSGRQAAGRPCSEAEALAAADAALQAGERHDLHALDDLLRLSRLLDGLDGLDTEANASRAALATRVLSDRSLSDPRQRLALAEDAVARRARVDASNARLVASVRGGPAR